MAVKQGVQTSSTILPIRANGERPSMHVRGATAHLHPSDLDLEVLHKADALLVGGPETMPHFLTEEGINVLSGFHALGKPVFMDLLHSGAPADPATLLELIARTDWFMPNDDQLRALTGIDDLVGAARSVLAAGAGAVAVTTGADGALLVRNDAEPVTVPAFTTRVVDTTGCGDSFNSGMMTGILISCSAEDAALVGCACGALVASGLGSDAGITDLDGVLAVIAHDNADAAARISAQLAERSTR
ncbi:MAG: carbohydrate kinase family protein [Cumulibacter sp.]